MPIKRPQLVNNEFYHIVKRGVEEREIFLDDEDRLRFVNSLLVFNDIKPAPWGNRAFWLQREQFSLGVLGDYKPENPLVEVHAFALMKNHFHLLLRQLVYDGITDFMRKLGGYSYYFNKKYERVGPLFQGRFKAVLIKTENQLRNVFVYIHTNPLAIIEFNWKERGLKDSQKALSFLREYRWSSHKDFIGVENFPNLIYKDFFSKILGDEKNCEKEIKSWILYKTDTTLPKDVALE